MYAKERDFQIFIDLGLTIVQAKVFISLADKDFLKAKEISFISKVSRPDVYRVLKKLQEAGLIEQEMSKPYRFRAIPSEIALDLLITRRDMKTKELKMKTNVFLNNAKNNLKNNSLHKDSVFVLFPSKESLILRIKKTIQKTKKTIIVLTSHSRFTYACYCLSEDLTSAWNRGVVGRALIDKKGEKLETETFKTWKYPSAEIQYISETPCSVVSVFDKSEAYFFIDPTIGFKDSPALWSNNPCLVNIAIKYFEFAWTQTLNQNQKLIKNMSSI